MPCERGRLGAHTLLHAAVAAERVHVEVEQLEARPVEIRSLPPRGDRHADGRGEPSPQGAGGGLHTRGPPVLGVPRRSGPELTESPQVVQGHGRFAHGLVRGIHRRDPSQMQHRVQQRGGVSGRQDEPVPVGPDRVLRVEPQDPLPQRVRHRSHRHRRSRMARVRCLDGVHAQRADRGDRQGVRIGGERGTEVGGHGGSLRFG